MFTFPLPLELETSFEEVAEVVGTGRLVRVTMRGEVNSILERNCVLEALETSGEGVGEVVKTSRIVRMTMRGTSAPQSRPSANCVRTTPVTEGGSHIGIGPLHLMTTSFTDEGLFSVKWTRLRPKTTFVARIPALSLAIVATRIEK